MNDDKAHPPVEYANQALVRRIQEHARALNKEITKARYEGLRVDLVVHSYEYMSEPREVPQITATVYKRITA